MFKGTITIGGKKIELAPSAYTPVLYKHVFGEDLLKYVMSGEEKETDQAEQLEVDQKLCYIMKKQAEAQNLEELEKSASLEDYYEFLNSISLIELIKNTSNIERVFMEQTRGSSVAKKKKEEQSAE